MCDQGLKDDRMPFRALAWLLILFLPLLAVSQREVRVPPFPCDSGEDSGSLSDALRTLASNETILLEPGEHCVRNFSLVQGLSDISLVGVSSDVKIRCREGQGLAFLNISNLSLRNLTIDGCGLTGQPLNATLMQLMQVVELFIEIPDTTQIAILLGHVEQLSMERVTVSSTSGLGLAGVNVIGNSSLSEVQFSYNIRPGICVSFNTTTIRTLTHTPDLIGGGAYFVYYDYLPGGEPAAQLNPPRMVINNANFSYNSECTYSLVQYVNFDRSRALQRTGYSTATGGGLAVVLTQQRYGADLIVNSSLFRNNTARYGGGASIQAYAGVRDTRIAFDNCLFDKNGFTYEDAMADLLGTFSAGAGGISIALELYRPGVSIQPYSGTNRQLLVEITNSNFTENGARIGGGLILFSFTTPGARSVLDVPKVLCSNCLFTGNMAPVGAAMWMDAQKLNGLILGTLVELRDTRVMNNIARPFDYTIAVSQDNTAVTDIRGVNLTISGLSYFVDNVGTALQASGTVVGIDVNAQVYFERNSGVFGGAMTFIFYSYLILNANCSLYLRDNVGRSQGGAFYVNLIGSNSAVFFDDCFLYFSYDDFSVCDEQCADLNSTGVYVEFSGNIAFYNGSILYGSSLEFCPWAVELRRQGYNERTVFQTLNRYFPNRFNFTEEPNTPEEVTTLPRQLTIHSPQPSYSTVPGGAFILNVTVTDGLGQPVRSVLVSYVLSVDGKSDVDVIRNTASYVGSGFAFILGPNNSISAGVLSVENRTISVVVYSLDCLALAQQEIVIEVGFCPSGFQFENETGRCICDERLEDEGIDCFIQNLSLAIPDDQWYGPLSHGSSEKVVDECIEEYCEPGTRYIRVQEDPINYDVQCKSGSNRGGFLCGSCRDGYSIALGSQRCLNCNNSYIGLIVLFLALGILMIVMISYLQITLTGGYLNGVLFFSNIVSLYGPLLAPVRAYDGRLALASFLSLNLGIETCFHSEMTALEKIWWQLSFPLYLIFLMLVIRGLARCFKWKRQAGFSTIQGIATLSILCYVSVLQSSIELLGFYSVQTLSGKSEVRWIIDPTVEYFHGAHGFLAFVAICLLILYIIPLPLCLLFPQLLYRYRYVRNLKPFYDAFWDPFEPRFRFWLGLRLIARWITTALIFLAPAPQNLFGATFVLAVLEFFQLILQPFKGIWRNVSDGLFLLDLIILFTGSLYFRARDSGVSDDGDRFMEAATRFTSAFLVLAYLGFGAVVAYHIMKRFPKLQEALERISKRRKRDKSVVEVVPSRDDDHMSASTPNVQERSTTSVTFTELREPLLEDQGSVTIVSWHSKPETNDTLRKTT